MKTTAYDLDSIRGAFLCQGELLQTIRTELSHLSESIKYTKSERIPIKWLEVGHTVRLLDALMIHATNEFDTHFAELDEVATTVFDNEVRNR